MDNPNERAFDKESGINIEQAYATPGMLTKEVRAVYERLRDMINRDNYWHIKYEVQNRLQEQRYKLLPATPEEKETWIRETEEAIAQVEETLREGTWQRGVLVKKAESLRNAVTKLNRKFGK